MSDARYSRGSGGHYFFGLVPALLFSVVLHGLFLGFSGSQVPQPKTEATGRMHASIGKVAYLPERPVRGEAYADDWPQRAQPRKAIPDSVASKSHPVIEPVAQGGLPAVEDEIQTVPEGMDLSAYRLAVGRTFANLLGEELREGLPPGELLFRVRYRVSGEAPFVRLQGLADQTYAEQLHALMVHAVALTPVSSDWQTRGSSLELRALVVGE